MFCISSSYFVEPHNDNTRNTLTLCWMERLILLSHLYDVIWLYWYLESYVISLLYTILNRHDY